MTIVQNYSIAQLIDLLTGDTLGTSSFYLAQFNSDAYLMTYPYRVQCYAVGILQSGWLKITHNLTEHKIEAGQLMFIAPGVIHSINACSENFSMCGCFFTSDFLNEVKPSKFKLYKLPFFQGEAAPWLSLSQRDYQRLDANFDLLKMHYVHPPDSSQTLQYLLLALLMDMQQTHVQTHYQLQQPRYTDRPAELVDLFLRQVSQYYLTRHQVSEYAEQLAVSTKHLSETIKARTGKPASFFIDQMMLQEAQVLLRQTNRTVADISTYLQFSDQSAFGKFFRKKTGISPKMFRQKP